MHDTAHTIGGLFLSRYAKPSCKIVELGAMNLNGTLRDFCPRQQCILAWTSNPAPVWTL